MVKLKSGGLLLIYLYKKRERQRPEGKERIRGDHSGRNGAERSQRTIRPSLAKTRGKEEVFSLNL